jgi:hypothetical protein
MGISQKCLGIASGFYGRLHNYGKIHHFIAGSIFTFSTGPFPVSQTACLPEDIYIYTYLANVIYIPHDISTMFFECLYIDRDEILTLETSGSPAAKLVGFLCPIF